MSSKTLIVPSGQEDKFFSITQLPLTIVNDTSFQEVYFTDSLTLWDNGGQMRLKNASGDVEDAVDYGIVYGLDSDNDYVADSLLDSLYLRSSLTAVRRTSISAVEPPAGGDFDIDKPDPHISPLPNYGGARFGNGPGSKLYELKNHLGNVLAVVSDMKLGQGTTAIADYYLAELMAVQDYYPFGWLQPGRKWNNPSYRYGFNGMEKDDELKGNGNSLDFGARVLDTRLGRWLSVDPLAAKYPGNNPYQFALGIPTFYFDIDGRDVGKGHIIINNSNNTAIQISGDGQTLRTIKGGGWFGNNKTEFIEPNPWDWDDPAERTGAITLEPGQVFIPFKQYSEDDDGNEIVRYGGFIVSNAIDENGDLYDIETIKEKVESGEITYSAQRIYEIDFIEILEGQTVLLEGKAVTSEDPMHNGVKKTDHRGQIKFNSGGDYMGTIKISDVDQESELEGNSSGASLKIEHTENVTLEKF